MRNFAENNGVRETLVVGIPAADVKFEDLLESFNCSSTDLTDYPRKASSREKVFGQA